VAAKSFQAQGYAGTTTQDIVRHAGMSPGALHHHFPTKKSLALAVIQERVASELDETWIEALRAAPDARAGILGVFHSVADSLESRGSVTGCPVGNLALELSLGDADLRGALASNYDRWISAIEQKIIADQRSGESRFTASPRQFAEFVVSAFSGAMTLAKAEQDTSPLRSGAAQLALVMHDRQETPDT
jgi:AcrR family transcriptional regulator